MSTFEQHHENHPVHHKFGITNVNIFDGESFQKGTIIIDGGKIGGDREGAEMIDGTGKFLIPGLIDAHIHLEDEGNLKQLAAFGVTTAMDMGTWPAPKVDALRGRAGLTDIRSAGRPATAPGTMHSRDLPGLGDETVSNPAEAEAFVVNRDKEGSDFIKVLADIPGPDQSTLNALISAAHAYGKLTVAHAAHFAPFHMALEAKADFITHAPLDQALDDAAVTRMVDDKRISIPTLTMMKGIFEKLGPPADYLQSQASVNALYKAGVPILAGSDANAGEGTPLKVSHGDSLHLELKLLVAAGMSPLDALRGATVLPAKYFQLEDRGSIAEGLRADLVLLSANPLEDIRATRRIERVWICGTKYLVRLIL
ncbi:MAG: hypothetical protein M1818_005780 [Claussenomyces sp. TS43310]|nr:MAG: hypothetical protein M1818_005780 [Claussenomyces sp. TS43310]